MAGEDRRFSADELESLDVRPEGPDSREWELSFTTPKGEQITVELPPEAHRELLTSVEAESDNNRDRDNLATNERGERQDTTADTKENLPFLPEDPTLEFGRYLSMHRVLRGQTRYKILWLLVQAEELSLDAIEQELVIDKKESVADHVETLCDAYLLERWESTERGATQTSTTYRPTVFGRVALTEGIHELIRGEQDFEGMYDNEGSDTSGNENTR